MKTNLFARMAVAMVLALVVVGSLAPPAARAVTVNIVPIANYRDDFQGTTFPDGWRYQWNSGGAIGNSANYTDLIWNGASQYNTDGGVGLPRPAPGNFLFLGANGGHPGAGTENNSAVDRFAIARYTVAQTAQYSISDSFITRVSGGTGNELQIYVNNTQHGLPLIIAPLATVSFDTLLGVLNAGDNIFVAVGPLGNQSNDSFTWDFTINQFVPVIPEPSSMILLGLGMAALLGIRRRGRRGARA